MDFLKNDFKLVYIISILGLNFFFKVGEQEKRFQVGEYVKGQVYYGCEFVIRFCVCYDIMY